ncbi:MAG: hypothetical protein GY842_13145, partial [bacterium]|nr:hypothetical protein [bacterium]
MIPSQERSIDIARPSSQREGPGRGSDDDPGIACDRHDWWGDFDVDLADHAAFQLCFSGAGATPPQECLLSEGPCAVF